MLKLIASLRVRKINNKIIRYKKSRTDNRGMIRLINLINVIYDCPSPCLSKSIIVQVEYTLLMMTFQLIKRKNDNVLRCRTVAIFTTSGWYIAPSWPSSSIVRFLSDHIILLSVTVLYLVICFKLCNLFN
jgi:hypothetical protein